MREAVGNTFLFNVIIVFIFVILFILVGSLSYSKGFKAKNKIISIIEDQRTYDEEVINQIDQALNKNGYRTRSVFRHKECPEPKEDEAKVLLEQSVNYPYCVYQVTTERGIYYSVTVYTRFEVPLISGLLEFGVSGDTRTIYDLDAM